MPSLVFGLVISYWKRMMYPVQKFEGGTKDNPFCVEHQVLSQNLNEFWDVLVTALKTHPWIGGARSTLTVEELKQNKDMAELMALAKDGDVLETVKIRNGVFGRSGIELVWPTEVDEQPVRKVVHTIILVRDTYSRS